MSLPTKAIISSMKLCDIDDVQNSSGWYAGGHSARGWKVKHSLWTTILWKTVEVERRFDSLRAAWVWVGSFWRTFYRTSLLKYSPPPHHREREEGIVVGTYNTSQYSCDLLFRFITIALLLLHTERWQSDLSESEGYEVHIINVNSTSSIWQYIIWRQIFSWKRSWIVRVNELIDMRSRVYCHRLLFK